MRIPYGYGSGQYDKSMQLALAFMDHGTAFEATLKKLDDLIEQYATPKLKELFGPNINPAKYDFKGMVVADKKEKGYTSTIRCNLSGRNGGTRGRCCRAQTVLNCAPLCSSVLKCAQMCLAVPGGAWC